jgi:predicted nucleic acid-binding protein
LIVIDTSVAVKWVVDEPDCEKARLVNSIDRDLIAPNFLVAEVGNAFRKKENLGEISAEQCDRGLVTVLGLIDRFVSETELVTDALSISRRFSHPIYDCFFLAAALRNGLLLTADMKFVEKIVEPNLRRRIITLNCAEPNVLDAAVAACKVSNAIQNFVRFQAEGITQFEFKAFKEHMEASGLTGAGLGYMSGLTSVLHEFPAQRLVQEIERMDHSVQRDVITIIYIGSDLAEVSDWEHFKSEASYLVEKGVEKLPEAFVLRASDFEKGLRKIFSAYLPGQFA